MKSNIIKEIPNNTLEDTIGVMRDLAHKYATSMKIRDLVVDICSKIPNRDYNSEVLAIYYWVLKNIRYIRDIDGVEFVRTPDSLLDVRSADCDDMAMLIATMLISSGFPVDSINFVICDDGQTPIHNGNIVGHPNFIHVFTQVNVNGTWVTLDPVAHSDTENMLRNIKVYRRYPVAMQK